MKKFRYLWPEQVQQGLLAYQVRDLLYLLVTQADAERSGGSWPALRRFQDEYMEEA